MTPKLEFETRKEDKLLRRFEEIHNFIYANDGLSPQQVLEEIVKILFIKILSENSDSDVFTLENVENLFNQTKNNYAEVFANDEKIRLSADSLRFTVEKLGKISLNDSSNDAKGLAFQKFLRNYEKGERGQFFTPAPIIDFCVEIIQPQPHEKIIDPACGSGGFLISALKFVENNFPNINKSQFISRNLIGLDINWSIAKIARMKLILEADTKTNIFCQNALEETKFGHFDIVLANPPFGTTGKITNDKLLSKFDLGHKWTRHENNFYSTRTIANGQVTEILFIEKCLSLLREGGRMAIVLPNGNFENPSLEYLRYYIRQKAKILAVVNLPNEAFIPFGTGVKTSLLFLEKQSNAKGYDIFFGKVTKLGYQGNKNGTPIYLKDNKGNPLRDEQGEYRADENFSEISQNYQDFRLNKPVKSEKSFAFPSEEINGRLDYDFYSPETRKFFEILQKSNSVKLGEVVEIVKHKSPKLLQKEGFAEYVELSDVNTHALEIINSTNYQVHELPSRASYEIKTGDIITAIAGNSVGTQKHATALVSEEFEGAICTNGFRVLRNFKVDKYYLLYFLKSEMFLRQMFIYRTGAAIPNVSDSDLAKIIIQLPKEKQIEEISRKVQESFRLRVQAKQIFENIA